MRVRVWCVTLASLALCACSKHHPVAPVADTSPQAVSPQAAVERLRWAWTARDPARYSDLLTADFTFVFAPNDSTGNVFAGHRLNRELDALSATHLLSGGGQSPAASEVELDMGSTVLALPDPRPGKTEPWHRSVRAQVSLRVVMDYSGTPNLTTISGAALFYLVRGDSAHIPPELIAQGVLPDSTRWWIERWEDETSEAFGASRVAAGPRDAVPTANRSWGALKALYVEPVPVLASGRSSSAKTVATRNGSTCIKYFSQTW